jgi:hypothetical protein
VAVGRHARWGPAVAPRHSCALRGVLLLLLLLLNQAAARALLEDGPPYFCHT